jgi:hypothetical protein
MISFTAYIINKFKQKSSFRLLINLFFLSKVWQLYRFRKSDGGQHNVIMTIFMTMFAKKRPKIANYQAVK